MSGSLLYDLLFNGEALCNALNIATIVAPLYAFILYPLYFWLFKDALEAMDRVRVEPCSNEDYEEEGEDIICSEGTAEYTPGRLSRTSNTRGSAQVSSPFTLTTTEAILRATRGSSLGSCDDDDNGTDARHLFLANSTSPSHPRRSTASPSNTTNNINNAADDECNTRRLSNGSEPNVLQVESRARRLFSRCVRSVTYDQTGCTRQALHRLYSRPAFQNWYCMRRPALLEQVQLRERTAFWRHISMMTLLLISLCALPAFSFANTGSGVKGLWPTLRSLRMHVPFLGASGVAQNEYSIAQLLCSRVQYVRNGSRDQARWWLSLFGLNRWWGQRRATHHGLAAADHTGLELTCAIINVLINEVETLLILTAACVLLTSVWLVRDSGKVALATLLSYLFLLAECVMVPHVTLRLGMGFLVSLGIVLARLVSTT